MTKAKTYEEKSGKRDGPLPSSPNLPMVPIPRILESSFTFNGNEEQIGVVMESIKTSQGSPMHNVIEEATHKILSYDSLNLMQDEPRTDAN